jgi:SAM-dependent methyltransferase
VKLGQRFARLVTNAVVRQPRLWALFRGPFRRQFEELASTWETRQRPDTLEPFARGLDTLETPPRRVLDVGTGTGAAAFLVARRWPDTEITGVDLANAMVAEARRATPRELRGRVRFEVADAAELPFPDGAFDLVTHANMLPFFDELARVVEPGGAVVFAFSGGAGTPIYVPPERLRRELERRGFNGFEEVAAARGVALVARKSESD